MTGPALNAKVSRLLLELFLLWLYFCISVADKKAEEWEEWGACAVTCGTGQRTRVGCTKELKSGKSCPPGRETTQTEMCSTASCSPSPYSPQAQLSPDDITSSSITSSVTTSSSSSASFSSLLILTSSSPRKTSSLGFASSARTMTASSESVVGMPSTQFNQVSLKRTTTSTQTSRVTGEAMSRISSSPVTKSSRSLFTETSFLLALTSSSPIMTSSVVSSSLHAKYSSPLPSSALMMTSSSSSLIRISPSKSSQVILKSTASFRSPSGRNDTTKDDSSSRQAYFSNGEENWILQNHVIKDIWTSSKITCAMMCLREKNCQSINVKSKTKDSRQSKNANTRKDANCQLNSAKHLVHPMDFFPKKGYRYYYII